MPTFRIFAASEEALAEDELLAADAEAEAEADADEADEAELEAEAELAELLAEDEQPASRSPAASTAAARIAAHLLMIIVTVIPFPLVYAFFSQRKPYHKPHS